MGADTAGGSALPGITSGLGESSCSVAKATLCRTCVRTPRETSSYRMYPGGGRLSIGV